MKEGASVEFCIRLDKRTNKDIKTINVDAGSYFVEDEVPAAGLMEDVSARMFISFNE